MKNRASLVLLVAPTVMACAAAVPGRTKDAHTRIATKVRLFKHAPFISFWLNIRAALRDSPTGILPRTFGEGAHYPLGLFRWRYSDRTSCAG